MKRKNNPKSTSKPPNKQSVIDVSDDEEQPDFPSAPGSSLESDKLDDKTKDQSKSKATPGDSKGKRGRPKGSKNTKTEKESKAKGSTKSKKNVPEVIESDDEENVSENEDAGQLQGTQEVEEVYHHTKMIEVINLEEPNEIQTQISEIFGELKNKALNARNPPPTMEEEKEEEEKAPEDDISIEASETENKNNTQETQEQQEEDDEEPCQICYSQVSQKFLQPETRHLFKIIRCKECKIAVHRICVGKEALLSKKVSEFVCDSCQSGVKSDPKTNKYKCHVCSNEGGYLHHASNSKWCHLLCAISTSTVLIKDVANMSIDISSFRKEVGKIPNGNKCTICQVKVGTLRSTDKDNGHFCHLHCALREAKLKPKNANWSANFRLIGTTSEEYEENHTVIKNVDIRSEVIIQNIENIQSRLSGDIEKIIHNKLDSKDKSPKKKGKNNEEVAPATSKIFERVKRSFASRFNLPANQPETKSFELDHFSGKLIFTEKFRGRQDNMEVEDDENPLNGNAKKLASQLISFLSDELTNEDSLYETSHSLVPSDRVVKGHLPAFQPIKSVSLPEVLFFVNVFQKRIEAATRNICEEGSLVEIFNLADMIPFAVTGLLTPVYEKFYTAIAADLLMTPEIDSCSPLKIYNPLTKTFDQNNLRKNTVRLHYAESLKENYFNKPCQIITIKTREVHSLIHQLRFLTEEFYNDLKDIFASKDASSNASSLRATPLKVGSLTPVKEQLPPVPDYKMVKLYERANEIGLPQDSEEMKLMDLYIKKSKFASAVVEDQSEVDIQVSPAPSPNKRMQEESPRKSEKLTPSKLLLRDIDNAFASPSSNKGKISQPKIVVNLPPRDGLVKKPKYLKDDKDWNGKEKEYELQLKLLQQKPKLQEIEDELASLGPVGTINQRQALERKKERAFAWKQNYLEAVRENDGNKLKKAIDDIDSIDIYFDEMKEAYEHRVEWAHCRIKVELLNKMFKQQTDHVDFAILEEVVKEGEQIPQCEPDEGDKFGYLQGKYEIVKKAQKHLTTGVDDYGDPLKINNLEYIKEELRRQKVKIPEAHLLDEKLEVNKNINKLRNETLTTEALEQKINEISVHFSAADESFVEQLNQRLQTAKDLSRQAVALIEGSTRYNLQDLSRMANLVQQARDERLIVSKVGVLETIVNSYLLFEKVRAYFLNTPQTTFERLRRGEFMETEEQPENLIQDLDNKLSELGELESDQVEELARLCYGVKVDHLTSFEALYNFFQKLLTIIRRGEAKNILNKEYKRVRDIEDFLESLPKTLELPEQERQLFREIEKEGAKIKAWKNAVDEFLRTKPEEKIKNIYERAGDQDLDLEYITHELDNLTQEIERLNKWFKNDLEAYQDLDDETSHLHRLYNCTHYIEQGLQLRKQVESDTYTSLDDIEGLIDAMRGAGLPPDDGLGGLLNSWCDEVREVKKDFDLKYGRKKDFGKLEVENYKVKDLIRKNASKPSREDADAMVDTIESVKKYATLDREVNSILSDVQQLKLWNAKIKEATEIYKDLYEEGDMEIEQEEERNKLRGKQEEISKKLTELKTEMMGLTLRDEKGETSLLLFEWICDAVFLLNGLKKNATYQEWKSLMDIQENFGREEAKKIQHLTQRLEKAFLKAQKINEFVEKLQELTKQLEAEEDKGKIEMVEDDQRRESFENIEAIMEDCDKCPVPMKEAKKVLEDIYKKCNYTKKRAQDCLKATDEKKITLHEIESLQKHIRKLPVNLFEEYKALDDMIVEANRINTEAGKVALKDSIKTDELLARYQNCPVSLPSMKRLTEFKDNFSKLKAVEEQLKDLSDNQLTYDDLGKIEDIRFELENKIDDAYSDTLRKYIFIKRCRNIQKKKEEGTSDFHLTYSSIKSLRIDGGDLKDKFSEDTAVIEAFRFINDIWKKVEDKTRDIEQIQDVDKLSGLSKIVSGIVDIEEFIIDKRANLAAKLQNNIQPYKYNLQYTEERKVVEPVKRKRGRPRKGEEKNPRKETTAERDRKSKEKSRNREKSDNVMRKKREEASSKRPASKEMKTLGHYYARTAPHNKDQILQNLAPTSNRESILKFIKQIFDMDGHYLRLESIETIKIGEEILKMYPVVLESGKHQQALKKKLQNLLGYKYISTRLFTDRNCLRNNFKSFIKKKDEDLQKIEKRQKQKFVPGGRPIEYGNRRPQPEKENLRDTRDSMPGELRKERLSLQDRKNKPEPARPTVNEKKFKVHTDARQTQLKYDRKRSGEDIRASQEYTDTGYNAFTDSQPAPAKVSRSSTRIIQAEPILRESALKHPIRKKGQPRDIPEYDQPVVDAPPLTDFNYEDISTNLEQRFHDNLESSLRKTTKTPAPEPEPRHDNIYRILEGSLENVDGTQKLKMALFTCDDSRKISKIPQFTDTDPLKIKFKKHKNKVEDYFNNVLNEDSGIRIISGWVENRISIYQSRCEQIAQDFLQTDTIGTTTYDHKSTRILFLHKDQINSTWKSKLKFRTKRLTKTSNPILCFIIITRADRLTKNTRYITPIIEKQLGTTPRKGSVDSLDSLDSLADWEEELSQASSINDYEPDFGQLVEPRNIPYDQTSIESGGEDDERPRKPGVNRHGKREYAEYSEDEDEYRPRKKIQVDFNKLIELREMDPEDAMVFIADLDDDERDAYRTALRNMALEEGEDLEPSETQDYTDEEARTPEPTTPVNPIDSRYPIENLIQEQKFFELQEPKPRNRFPFLFNPENQVHFFDEPPQPTLPIVMNPNPGLRQTQPFRFEEDSNINTPSRQLQGHKKGNFGGNKFHNAGKKSGNKNNQRFNKNNNRKFNKGKGGNNKNQVQPNDNIEEDLNQFVGLIKGAKLEGGKMLIPKSLFEELKNVPAQIQHAEFTAATIVQNIDQNSSINPSQELDPLHAPLSSFKDPNEENR